MSSRLRERERVGRRFNRQSLVESEGGSVPDASPLERVHDTPLDDRSGSQLARAAPQVQCHGGAGAKPPAALDERPAAREIHHDDITGGVNAGIGWEHAPRVVHATPDTALAGHGSPHCLVATSNRVTRVRPLAPNTTTANWLVPRPRR